jgi:predicted nuclease with TOPRIM domain
MKWHIAHRHDIPTAFDALAKDYQTKLVGLEDENTRLKQKLDRVEGELVETKLKLCDEVVARASDQAMIKRLWKSFNIAVMALALRDILIKEKLNMQLKNPFE